LKGRDFAVGFRQRPLHFESNAAQSRAAFLLAEPRAAKSFEAGDLPGAAKEIQNVEAASKHVLQLLDELGK